MFQLAWRWPILALVLAGGAYTFKHYTIGGIEHLHLLPRSSGASASTSSSSASSASSLGLDWNSNPFAQAGRSAFPNDSASAYSDRHAPAWRDRLTTAEKFTMWQEGRLSSADPTVRQLPSNPNAPDPLTSQIPPLVTGIPGMPAQGIGSENAIPVPPGFQSGPGQIAAYPPMNSDIPRGNMTSVIASNPETSQQLDPSLLAQTQKTIRVASFNSGSLGTAKLAKPHALETLVSTLRQFDVIALQEIQSTRDDLLPIIVEKLNQSGRHYDYVIGPRLGRVPPKAQYAIVFDAERLETDRYQLYTVDDPEDLMTYEPLVAWFRCKEVPSQAAFTFSLINVRVDYNLAAREASVLPQLIEAVQGDGRGEDDWIIAGDIGGSVANIPQSESSAFLFALRDLPTNVEGTRALDTIFFSSVATTEYTGRSGVFDFLRNYNLSMERALEISDHLPVWAEFSIVEGAVPGRVAPVDPASLH